MDERLNEKELALLSSVIVAANAANDRKNLVLQMLQATRSLTDQDSVDLQTGVITRKPEEKSDIPF